MSHHVIMDSDQFSAESDSDECYIIAMLSRLSPSHRTISVIIQQNFIHKLTI